ncbi:MAG: hypothetical protein HQM08_16715 [Candidatus Riflebacteria bacterium]|nr:hypothetical protein [Candidatus Riflebacteria bacterium]
MSNDDSEKEKYHKFVALVLESLYKYFVSPDFLFSGVFEPRHPSYIVYSQPALFTTAMFMYLFRLKSRKQIDEFLRNEKFNEIYQKIFKCDVPSGDAVADFFEMLDISETSKLSTNRFFDFTLYC